MHAERLENNSTQKTGLFTMPSNAGGMRIKPAVGPIPRHYARSHFMFPDEPEPDKFFYQPTIRVTY